MYLFWRKLLEWHKNRSLFAYKASQNKSDTLAANKKNENNPI